MCRADYIIQAKQTVKGLLTPKMKMMNCKRSIDIFNRADYTIEAKQTVFLGNRKYLSSNIAVSVSSFRLVVLFIKINYFLHSHISFLRVKLLASVESTGSCLIAIK